MPPKPKLSPTLSLEQFDRGYWYATEIKAFAKEIGIPNSSQLRKDELEKIIRKYLQTGKLSKAERNTAKTGEKDIDLGLKLDLPIVNYTSNKVTKQFIEREVQKLHPGLKKKSGARYRLNRWREEQLAKGKKITYGDLVKEYVKLNAQEEPFDKIPQVRYINFLSDYLKKEPDATRAGAIKAWKKLKKMDAVKDYASWKKVKNNPMKRSPLLTITMLILFSGCYVPNKKERAQKKFEVFFAKFKAAYPADHYEYHYSNYSPLYKLPKPVPFKQSIKNGMLGEGPIIYTQTAQCVSFNQQDDTIRNDVFIQYNEKLDVVTFGTINP